MNTRHELSPIPSLADYALGEKLGAGSYGKYSSRISIALCSILGTVYKARLISVCEGGVNLC